jgi:hypothetical protein
MPDGTYRILVTGSRTWTGQDAVWAALDAAAQRAIAAGCTSMVVVAGAAADGADQHAKHWALISVADGIPGIVVSYEPHAADWFPKGYLDKSAGFRRNALMVSLGADECLAFAAPCASGRCRKPRPHDSHGTADCVTRAEKAGIPVRRITSDA